MIRVIKGNREVCIDDADLSAYLEQGYSVIDNKGNVVKVGKATTIAEVIAENKAMKKEHEKMERHIAEIHDKMLEKNDTITALENELAELKKTIAASKPTTGAGNTKETDQKPKTENGKVETKEQSKGASDGK